MSAKSKLRLRENFRQLKFFINESKKLGLSINESKCELFIPFEDCKDEIILAFREIAPNIKIISGEELSLLGLPLTESAAISILSTKIDMYQRLSDRLKTIHHHAALFLFSNCMAIPMMTYLLRSAPLHQKHLLKDMDNILKSSLECFLNSELDDEKWNQASLPIYLGGISIRKLSDIVFPAYCASVYSTNELANSITNFNLI